MNKTITERMLDNPGLTFLIFVTVLISLLLSLGSYASCRSARVFNRIHNTSYTCSDFFWASDQINSQTQTINLGK